MFLFAIREFHEGLTLLEEVMGLGVGGGGGGGWEDWYYYFTVSQIRVSRPPASVPRFIFLNHKVKTGQKAGKHQVDGT